MPSRLPAVRNIVIAILLLVLGGSIGYRYGQTGQLPLGAQKVLPINQEPGRITDAAPPEKYQDVSFQTFWEVWGELEKDYLRTNKLVPKTMVDGAISGMTASLGDPYTVYLPPDDNQRSGEDLAGSFFGVGIELGYKDNTLAVISPLQGMPAEKAGVQAGDLILHVKDPDKNLDEDTTGWSLTEAVNHIRGRKGTDVILTLYRQDKGEPFEVTLKRDEIVVKSVELEFVEHQGKRVAHLKLLRFGERTEAEWDEAVNRIVADKGKIHGIVLDMRNNPGGFFDGAISISSDFVEDGTVVIQKGKYSQQEFPAKGKARLSQFPVDVLLNRGSASASEIVAGALRDQRGAKLIGEKSFGKGTVQDRRELSNGGGLHVTIAEWLTPKGNSIHDVGLPATVEVTDNPETPDDEVVFKAIESL